jgi:hypothetical protein
MIHRLEIENFYSIRDTQVIDLRASANAPEEPGRLAPLWKGATEKGPKVVALFGANASGKSNVLKALSFIMWFVKDSFSAPRGARMPFDRFNDSEMLQSATRLAIHLAGFEDIAEAGNPEARRCRYAYEVTIGGGAGQSVDSEALYYWPARASRLVRLFERNASGDVVAAKAFGLAGYHQALTKVLRPDASVIATLAQLEHPFSKLIWQAATHVSSNILIDRNDWTDDVAIRYYAANPRVIETFNREIERVDLGIQAMQVEQGLNGPAAWFSHHNLAVRMPMVYESHGTRQFIKLYPYLLHALETGSLAILDELDATIHPMMLPEILRWFHDPERNPHNGQLWMSCHAASLLEDLTKEEVLFCEKDQLGRTRIYPLRNIQSVRRTDNYYRKYLSGAFGAVPQIG